jgi:hypothetical protein
MKKCGPLNIYGIHMNYYDLTRNNWDLTINIIPLNDISRKVVPVIAQNGHDKHTGFWVGSLFVGKPSSVFTIV